MSDTSFSEDIEQLLDLERSRPSETPDMLDRLRDRLSTTLGPLDALDTVRPEANTAHAPTEAAKAAASGIAGTKIALVAFAAFAVGGVAGAKWESSRAPSPPLPVSAPVVAPTLAESRDPERPLATAASGTADSGVAIDISSLPLVKPAATAAASLSPNGAERDGRDPLGRERTLIDVARTASSRGKLVEAMAALDEHAAKFPRGALSEEREGLRIQLLLAQGRSADARARAASFRKTFPTSLMLPAIDAQLGVVPVPSATPEP